MRFPLKKYRIRQNETIALDADNVGIYEAELISVANAQRKEIENLWDKIAQMEQEKNNGVRISH
jgi:hypothetical protein